MYTVNKSFNESMEELGMEMDPLFQEEAFTKQMDLPQMNLADWAFDTSVIEELKLRIVDLFAGTMTPKQAADFCGSCCRRGDRRITLSPIFTDSL